MTYIPLPLIPSLQGRGSETFYEIILIDKLLKSLIQSMCHSRLPTPETTFSLCACISGNGGQVKHREKSNVFSMLYRKDFSLSAVVAEATMAKSACSK